MSRKHPKHFGRIVVRQPWSVSLDSPAARRNAAASHRSDLTLAISATSAAITEDCHG